MTHDQSDANGVSPNVEKFEEFLSELCKQLTAECLEGVGCKKAGEFEDRVRERIAQLHTPHDSNCRVDAQPHAFPDIVVGCFGIEVKFTTNDTWRSVANSVFEGTRKSGVEHIYIVFGKMGGNPEVKWGRYEDCVIHVRTSHVPRFEVQIGAKESLFHKLGVPYAEFSKLPIDKRMTHIRSYARSRLKQGERLWWLEESPGEGHTLPIQARIYMTLEQKEKRRLRAEAALLCPEIVKPSSSKHKYDNLSLFLLTYHGVLCPQARDLFSAGSVAMRTNSERGGNYIVRGLLDIQSEMAQAAEYMDDDLFVEYWGRSIAPAERISEWLKRADELAKWPQKPSEVLFRNSPAPNAPDS